MEITFSPSPDVVVILNALLDKLESRARQNAACAAGNSQPLTRPVKIALADINLPGYFSQTDPEPRLTANQQLQQLSEHDLINLAWLPGESGHLLDAVALSRKATIGGGEYALIYTLLRRQPLASSCTRLENLLLADRFRFAPEDWRGRAVGHVLHQLRSGRSPSPFSLADPGWNSDLLILLEALPGLSLEMPYRVFSVHTFNDSKRFEELKPALVRLARLANPQWKSLPAEELLRELNLVANPGYIHLAGHWQLITCDGEILSSGGFSPSIGFPAAQVAFIQAVTVHAEAILCIENLTTFHEFARTQEIASSAFAVVCTLGNPSPAIRRLLRLTPAQTPTYLWSDLDYGGFNILSQLRLQVSSNLQPFRMDISTFEAHAHLSRPLSQSDVRNLRRLCIRPELRDVRPVMEHLLERGLKLEQEAISGCPPRIKNEHGSGPVKSNCRQRRLALMPQDEA